MTSQISCSGLNLSIKNSLIVVTNLIFCESLLWDLPINIQWKLNMESRGIQCSTIWNTFQGSFVFVGRNNIPGLRSADPSLFRSPRTHQQLIYGSYFISVQKQARVDLDTAALVKLGINDYTYPTKTGCLLPSCDVSLELVNNFSLLVYFEKKTIISVVLVSKS